MSALIAGHMQWILIFFVLARVILRKRRRIALYEQFAYLEETLATTQLERRGAFAILQIRIDIALDEYAHNAQVAVFRGQVQATIAVGVRVLEKETHL